MAKIKFTKGELKKQRDDLKRFERYLPILQMKKQQLQMEMVNQQEIRKNREQAEMTKKLAIQAWSGVFTDLGVALKPWLLPAELICDTRNIAGIDLPVFKQLRFPPAEYDLFIFPLWVDAGIDRLRELLSLRQEIKVIDKSIGILQDELRITSQRVNLFEKVKIPLTQENIRVIKIYIADQMANAVGRSKIAKQKIEEFEELYV